MTLQARHKKVILSRHYKFNAVYLDYLMIHAMNHHCFQ